MKFDCITSLAKNPTPQSLEWGTTQTIVGGVLRQTSEFGVNTVKGDILRLTIFEDGVETIIIDVDKEVFIEELNKEI